MPDVPTPKHGLPQPADGDLISTWPALMRDALGDLDTLIAVAIENDPRPAAGKFGRVHRAPDGTISFDTGAAWVTLAQAAITDLAAVPISGVIAYAGSVLPAGGWAWADGSLIDRQVAGVDTTFFTRVGHAYNGGVDPGSGKVRLPDKRGRVPVGADNFGAGAAGRLPNSNRARGQNGGEERHQMVNSDLPAGTLRTGGANFYGYLAFDSTEFSAGEAEGVHQSGASTPFNNMQPYEVDNYIVRIA